MIEKFASDCIGCGSCETACPVGCITMTSNEEGFLIPSVDVHKCVGCGKCQKVCPVSDNEPIYDISSGKIFGARVKSEFISETKKSASAGVFYQLAECFIEKKGSVFGAAFDDSFRVKHICAETSDEIKRMQNSKYVQSETNGVFKQIKEILEENPDRYVLFSGTPCQCAALKKYLNKEYKNLFLVDFICHGVPSPLAFEKYLRWFSEKINEKVEDYHFRYKYKGWNYNGRMSSYVKFNEHFIPVVKDPYMTCFLKETNYRESCYRCKFNTTRKAADITLGDLAGVIDICPDFYDKSGCSVVIENTDKGKEAFWWIKERYETIPLSFDDVKKYNKNVVRPSSRTQIRDEIYQGIETMSDSDYVKKRLSPEISIKSVILFYVPLKIKRIMKKILRRK